jgi:hypothetical protein
MKVTFLAGPRHAEHDDIPNPPDGIASEDENGKTVIYEKVSVLSMSAGNGLMAPFHATYAIGGTPIDERNRLMKEVGWPPDLY